MVAVPVSVDGGSAVLKVYGTQVPNRVTTAYYTRRCIIQIAWFALCPLCYGYDGVAIVVAKWCRLDGMNESYRGFHRRSREQE